MSAEVQQFTFNGSAFRALNDESGESWFSGQDVCNILGTGTNHLREYLDEDEITNIRIHKDGTPFAYPPTPKLTRKGLALIHQRLSEQSFERVLDAEVAA